MPSLHNTNCDDTKEALALETIHQGHIKFYNQSKGFGIIDSDDFSGGVILPALTVAKSNLEIPVSGQKVEFRARPSWGRPEGKMEATFVTLVQVVASQTESRPSDVLWEGHARLGRDICSVTLSRQSIRIVNPGFFSTETQERPLSRISEVVLATGWFTDSVTIRGGGRPIELSSNGGGDIRELFAALQDRINRR